MSKTRVIYNMLGLYAGPSPASGYNFLHTGSGITNDGIEATGNINLIRNIKRVQSASYSIDYPQTTINQLGKRGSIYTDIISHPIVNFTVNYLQNGVLNEHRLGLNVNFTETGGANDGNAFYSNNFGVSLISGFVQRSLTSTTNLGYPFEYTDKRNIYIAFDAEGSDVKTLQYSEIDPFAKDYSVLAFGDCYMTSYSTRWSVGSFPETTASFVCENCEYLSSGSGAIAPSLETKSGISNGQIFALPSFYEGEEDVSVLRPGDVTLNIYARPKLSGYSSIFTGLVYEGNDAYYDSIPDLAFSISDLKVQSYSIDLSLDRRELKQLGHLIPIDRPIVFPVKANISLDAIVGDNFTGNLHNIFYQNHDFDLNLKVNHPNKEQVYLMYDVKRAKLENRSFDNNIGDNTSISLQFSVELDKEDLSHGLFISGELSLGNQFPRGVFF